MNNSGFNFLSLGNIVVRGPPVMHGYERNPDANADAFNKDGKWFVCWGA